MRKPVAIHTLVEQVKGCLAADRRVKFAYLFGSVARGTAGPLSDLDIAVYLDGRIDRFAYRLILMEKIARATKSEHFDLVVLNDLSPLLRHEIIKSGRLLKEDRQRRVLFAAATAREYLDTAYLREARFRHIKEQAAQGGFLGQ